MCECGCAERMDPLVYFPGPSDLTYGLAVYEGCEDCNTPAGVMLYEIPPSEMEHFGPPDWRRAVPWLQYRNAWREWAVPMIGRDQLLAAMKERLGDLSEYDADGALDDGSRALYDAVRATSAEAIAAASGAGTADTNNQEIER